MRNGQKFSRRTVITSMAAASTLAGSALAAEANHVDAELIALGACPSNREFWKRWK
jgi:hypothetical protein